MHNRRLCNNHAECAHSQPGTRHTEGPKQHGSNVGKIDAVIRGCFRWSGLQADATEQDRGDGAKWSRKQDNEGKSARVEARSRTVVAVTPRASASQHRAALH